jgi:hypothetical protein
LQLTSGGYPVGEVERGERKRTALLPFGARDGCAYSQNSF